ncbi:MAG TPA: hypothetical protein VF190_15975 [Rhodothermales bacterium]
MQPDEPLVVLHVGMHKTGTSTIQHYLHSHENELLREQAVYYADAGRTGPTGKDPSHYMLAWQSVQRYASKFNVRRSDFLWHALKRELAERRPRLAILSSEFFWPATEAEIAEMRANLGDLRPRIVLYVRNPLGMAVSGYKQGVKIGERWIDFETYLRQRLYMFDYGAVADRWSGVFGRDALRVRVYDRAKDALVDDFAETAGFKPTRVQASKSKNVSPPDGVIRLVRGLNLVEHKVLGGRSRLINRARRNILRRGTPGAVAYKLADALARKPLIRDADVAFLRREIGPLQERFLADYVPSEDHPYLRF